MASPAVLPGLSEVNAVQPNWFERLNALRAKLKPLDAAEAAKTFALPHGHTLFKTTISLCPECLNHISGAVFALEGKVWLRKKCESHGWFEALLENDERFYHLSNKDLWGRCYRPEKVFDLPLFSKQKGECGCGPEGCGTEKSGEEELEPREEDFMDGLTSQMSNKSCMVFVEITDACNLACPVCYSDAKGDRKLPLAEFKKHIERLIEAKNGLDSVQLTGGEAAMHPEYIEFIAWLFEQRVRKIYLPTNGILFADGTLLERLLPYRTKIMLQLQFDGKSEGVNQSLRAADPARVRMQVLEHSTRLDYQTQITMTVSKNVNEPDIGWVVDQGLARRNVKVIALQPVTFSGRYELKQDPMERLTLSDIIKGVVARAQKNTQERDYIPIPCSHPNCGWVTLFIRRFGITANVVKHVDLPKAMNTVSYKAMLTDKELREAVGSRGGILHRAVGAIGRHLFRSKDVLTIGIKPYMDRFNYDQDRVSNCCTHLLDTQGNPVSFCEYNALVRQRDSWQKFPTIK